MDNGSLTISVLADKQYELRLELPARFCEQFSARQPVRIWGHVLGPTWGSLQARGTGEPAMRVLSVTFRTLERCEEVGAAVLREVEYAKAGLVTRKSYRAVLDLTPGNRTLVFEEQHNGNHDKSF